MANEKNLKPFTKDNQPPGHKKSRKGIPNRATVFKRLLEIKVKVDDPKSEEGSQKKTEVTLYEAMALGQIKSAINGNTRAFQEIQDSIFGKLTTPVNLKPEDLKALSDQELDELIGKLSR